MVKIQTSKQMTQDNIIVLKKSIMSLRDFTVQANLRKVFRYVLVNKNLQCKTAISNNLQKVYITFYKKRYEKLSQRECI